MTKQRPSDDLVFHATNRFTELDRLSRPLDSLDRVTCRKLQLCSCRSQPASDQPTGPPLCVDGVVPLNAPRCLGGCDVPLQERGLHEISHCHCLWHGESDHSRRRLHRVLGATPCFVQVEDVAQGQCRVVLDDPDRSTQSLRQLQRLIKQREPFFVTARRREHHRPQRGASEAGFQALRVGLCLGHRSHQGAGVGQTPHPVQLLAEHVLMVDAIP